MIFGILSRNYDKNLLSWKFQINIRKLKKSTVDYELKLI